MLLSSLLSCKLVYNNPYSETSKISAPHTNPLISHVLIRKCSSVRRLSGALAAFLFLPATQFLTRANERRGVIGPTRQFGPHALYKPELYALVVGAVLPIPFWLWQKRYPQSWLKYFSMPVLLNGPGSIPPALGINYSSWFVVAFIFRESLICSRHHYQHHSPFRDPEYVIRRRSFRWWSKFNYILSSALDSGRLLPCWVFLSTLPHCDFAPRNHNSAHLDVPYSATTERRENSD